MVGSGPELFAVWGYVIANTVDSQVELNPRHLASLLGMTPQAIIKCIERLCAPDPESRSKVADGRRLIREGEFAYFVPNHAAYRAVRDEQDRREYNRLKKAEGRARGVNVRVKKSKCVKTRVNKSIRESTVSAQAEAEAEAEAETTTKSKAPRATARGKSAASKDEAAPVPGGHKVTWLTPFGTAWLTLYPGGEPPWKFMARYLAPLTKKHSTEAICAQMVAYFRREGQFATWPKFASTFGNGRVVDHKIAAEDAAIGAMARDLERRTYEP